MIKPIMKDVLFLAQKSEPATAKDKNIAVDLLDTLQANADRCVGMAANMIGVRKRIIVFDNEGTYMTMFNPEIIKKPVRMILRKVVFLWLAGPAPASVIRPSKFSGKLPNFKLASKTSPVGLRKSFSMKLTIVTEY